jgi:hypothetical protein
MKTAAYIMSLAASNPEALKHYENLLKEEHERNSSEQVQRLVEASRKRSSGIQEHEFRIHGETITARSRKEALKKYSRRK